MLNTMTKMLLLLLWILISVAVATAEDNDINCETYDTCVDCLESGCYWLMEAGVCDWKCDCTECSFCATVEDDGRGAVEVCDSFAEIRDDHETCGRADNCEDCFDITGLEYYDGCHWFGGDSYTYCAPRCRLDCGSDGGGIYDETECDRVGVPWSGVVLMEDGDEIHTGCDCPDDWKYIGDIYLKQQDNGNLVVRKGTPGDSILLWSNELNLEPGGVYYTRLQRDGNLITRRGSDKSGPVVWKTKTSYEKNQNYLLGLPPDLKTLELWKGATWELEVLLKSYKTKLA